MKDTLECALVTKKTKAKANAHAQSASSFVDVLCRRHVV